MNPDGRKRPRGRRLVDGEKRDFPVRVMTRASLVDRIDAIAAADNTTRTAAVEAALEAYVQIRAVGWVTGGTMEGWGAMFATALRAAEATRDQAQEQVETLRVVCLAASSEARAAEVEAAGRVAA